LLRRGMPTIFLRLGIFQPAKWGIFNRRKLGNIQPALTNSDLTVIRSRLRPHPDRGSMEDRAPRYESASETRERGIGSVSRLYFKLTMTVQCSVSPA
jgi:hypothetical protein